MSKSSKPEVTEQGFYTFLELSVVLTGFSENELLATGMHETYYYTIMKEPDPDNVRTFFNDARAVLDKYGSDEEELFQAVNSKFMPETAYLGLARRIVLLWYTGIWTSVQVVTQRTSQMVSPEAFVQGLIWAAAQTHPAGAKQPGYGSWENPPL